jgi:hypothetical protein
MAAACRPPCRPLQLCEHTTVAYAAAIQKAGGPPGLAFAFLLVAPATNLPSLVLLLKASGAAGAAAGAGAGSEGSSSATWRHAVVWRVAAALTLGALLLSYDELHATPPTHARARARSSS